MLRLLLVLLLLFVRERRAKLGSLTVDAVERGRFGVNRGALGVLGTVLLRFMFNRGNFDFRDGS